jgi:hypothetical protein
MKNKSFSCDPLRRVMAAAVAAVATFILLSQSASAESWNGIEPLKSRRADVERILGQPVKDKPGESGTLQFKVKGGTVTVTFISARFVTSKRLSPDVEGTVQQVIFQHDESADTPESMGLSEKSGFKRTDSQGAAIYTNQKEGIIHTFIGGRLKTTYYMPSEGQWGRVRKMKR